MAAPQEEPLRTLTTEELARLRGSAKATSERVDHVRHAIAILVVAEGKPFRQAAREAGLKSGTTVAGLVGRFNRCGLLALAIVPGRGRKLTYDAAARARIVATAQSVRIGGRMERRHGRS